MQELQEEAQEAALMSVQRARAHAHRAGCVQSVSTELVMPAVMDVLQ